MAVAVQVDGAVSGPGSRRAPATASSGAPRASAAVLVLAATIVAGACAAGATRSASAAGAASGGGDAARAAPPASQPGDVVVAGEPAREEGAGGVVPPVSGACVTAEERAAVDVTAPLDVRLDEALGTLEVPERGTPRGAVDDEAAAVRSLVLLESVAADASDPARARTAAMLVLDALGTLSAVRPGCSLEACARIDAVLARHCPVELPADDATAICPTLVLVASRCPGHAPRPRAPHDLLHARGAAS